MISILMPVKNAAKHLDECLESIIHQSYTDWELIAVDDHSTDRSHIILKLRTALVNSSGSFITRMDADDVMHRNKLDLMSIQLVQFGIGHLVTGFVKYFSNAELGDGYKKYASWLNDLSDGERNFDEIYKECVIPSPCWLIHRSDLEGVGAFNSEIYPEDYDLCFRFRAAGLKVKSVKQEIHHWRDHALRASRNDLNYADNNFFDLKIHHFLIQDYDKTKPLLVWGLGKKGKAIAKLLIENSIAFKWICNNDNKIGNNIYEISIEGIKTLQSIEQADIIVAVSNPEEQAQIKKEWGADSRLEFYYFC